jgi:hypothetical protein
VKGSSRDPGLGLGGLLDVEEGKEGVSASDDRKKRKKRTITRQVFAIYSVRHLSCQVG